MATQGVDYSSARPSPTCLFQEGKRFAIRYTHLGTPRPKAMTLAETTALTKAGLRVVTIFEETAGDMLRGRAAGEAAAKASLAMGKAAGMPPEAPHYFALDIDPNPLTDAQLAQCAAYLDGAAAVLGKHRVGLYAGLRGIEKLRSHCTYLWQTYAWSRRNNVVVWAPDLHLRQYKNNVTLCGGAVDLNDALVSDYGQWGVGVDMPSDLERAQAFARGCDPIPYRMQWEIGRDGIDCSGMMSAVINSLLNKADPFVRLFATGNIRDLVDAGKLPMLHKGMGDANDFNIGVVYPWEMSSGIGHCAGTLGGLNVESRGGDGVVIGAAARGATHSLFKHHYHVKIDSSGNVGEEDDSMSAADVTALKAHIDAKFDGLQPNLDRLALWIAGRPNRTYSPTAVAERLKMTEVDFETPLSPTTLKSLIKSGAVTTIDPQALTTAIITGLKAEGVLQVDVDEEALAGPVGDRVVEALREVTFKATS